MSISISRKSADFPIGLVADVDEAVEGPRDPRAHLAFACRPQREAADLEPGPVVDLDQLGDEERNRMILEIGREVGEADLVVTVALAAPDRPLRRVLLVRVGSRASQLNRRIGRMGEERERRIAPPAARDVGGDAVGESAIVPPIAGLQPGMEHVAACVVALGAFEHVGEVLRRLGEALQIQKRHAAIVQGLDDAGLEGERTVIARKRFFGALKLSERVAAIVPRFGEIRF